MICLHRGLRVIVEGKHQPIVTKEEFERVQKLIEEKRPQMEKCRKNRGVYSEDFWRRKSSTPSLMTRRGR